MSTERLKEVLAQARHETGKVIIGQHEVIERALIVIFTGNHALIEGVPGVAKTLLVRTLAHVLGCEFSRIQFTPDLMPADITGTNVFNLQRNEFTLIKGPIFTSFLLADEINRAPAKTQSALLQAMQERLVTIDRDTHALSPNFTVFATQNPIEYEGTYPLPEAQKDRFMLKITMNPPERDEELMLAKRTMGTESPEGTLASGAVTAVMTAETLTALRGQLNHIVIREELVAYLVDIVRTTRKFESVLVGAVSGRRGPAVDDGGGGGAGSGALIRGLDARDRWLGHARRHLGERHLRRHRRGTTPSGAAFQRPRGHDRSADQECEAAIETTPPGIAAADRGPFAGRGSLDNASCGERPVALALAVHAIAARKLSNPDLI